MAEHTPGPLQVLEGYEVWDTRGDGAPGIPLVKADLGLNRRWGRDIHGSEIVANLTLFAAAPDLLKALDDLAAKITEAFPGLAHVEPVKSARAAIAKARGVA